MAQNYIFRSPIGNILLSADEGKITRIEYLTTDIISCAISRRGNRVIHQAVEALRAYFHYPHSDWSFPVLESGTVFQQQVWQHLQCIPVGQTRDYSHIAELLNTSPRAVANACRANPFAIIIPCHRVIAKSGWGGYYGQTQGKALLAKQWLIKHEQHKI